jgi:uncharacterized Zn-finger protein
MESGCKQLPANRHQITAAIHALNITPAISLRPAIEGFSPSRSFSPPLIAYLASANSSSSLGYQCHICHKTFSVLHSLESHMNSPVHDGDEFKCPGCQRKFKLISGLVQHLESGSCGLSGKSDVEERFFGITAQFTRALNL